MAREHARLLTRIWSDADWRALPRDEQHLYVLLVSQGNVTQAGVLPLQTRKWAKGSHGTTEEDITKALAALEAARFVVVDHDTEEVLIRSFIRNDGVLKIPNVLKAALRAAVTVESLKLRLALAVELRRLRRKDASATADELDPTGSVTRSEPVANPLEARPEPVKVRDGLPEPAGVGVGEGEGEPLADGWVEEGERASEIAVEPEPSPAGQRPHPRCPRHRNDDNPPPCRACAAAREAAEAWDAVAARRVVDDRQAATRQAAADRAAAIANCSLCDTSGYVGTQLCDHDPGSADRAARGSAAVRAALAKHPAPSTSDAGTPLAVLEAEHGLTHHQTRPLSDAGYVTVEAVAELVDEHDRDPDGSALSSMPGMGAARRMRITGAIASWRKAGSP